MDRNIKINSLRSPFDGIFNVISGLPQGHEKPLKHALYNAVALLILIFCCATCWTLYLILEPFIKPLVWALLIGSVLHPFKYKLTKLIRKWFKQLDEKNTPVIIGFVVLPINIANDFSESVGNHILKRLKIIIGVVIAISLSHILYNYTPRFAVNVVWIIINFNHTVVSFLMNISSSSTIFVFVLMYITALIFFWKRETAQNFRYAAYGLWILISCCLCQIVDDYKLHIFVFLQFLSLAGFIIEILNYQEELRNSGHEISFAKCLLLVFTQEKLADQPLDQSDTTEPNINKNLDKSLNSSTEIETVFTKHEEINKSLQSNGAKSSTKNDNSEFELELFTKKATSGDSDKSLTSKSSTSDLKVPDSLKITPVVQTKITPVTASRRHTINTDIPKNKKTFIESLILSRLQYQQSQTADDKFTSDLYIYCVFWACCVLVVWKQIFFLALLPIPILIYIIKRTGYYFNVWAYLNSQISNFYTSIYEWCVPRFDALVPLYVRGIYKIFCKLNALFEATLRDSIDTVASTVVIFGLIVFLTLSSIFIFIQVYAEAIMLVQIAGNVINNTVVHNPELRQLLPPGIDDTIDSLIDNAYTYGREGISKTIRSMMSDVQDEKSAKLEQQVLELWDRVYQSWISADNSNIIGPTVTSMAVENSWNTFLEDLRKSPEMFNLSAIIEFLKQNVGTMTSLLESVWSILKGNISLVLGSFSAFVSIILGGGTAVLNFILNVIVFLTTLFYLLSSSGVFYKPVELLSSVSPSNGSRFGLALEQAVYGVFKATGKMALFYGLWTWFIHSLFNVKIVYLPTALATILGAVPFLGPYWACFPAVLDLWLSQDQLFLACMFAICQFAPCAFIDATIYQEIKGGGHPYLTALAIAGGIFWLGVEGAIIGPIMLCGLFVVVDLSSALFRESPLDDTSLPIRLHRMDSVL
ncbi:transmembrane protein 245 [Chrysoperla carnea]|uniref:transmembrane protein 245 n=1 Tax=Chrysoperla carnea TaxID=189513 RepID=UPI001D078D51|nr:transmembrane protein 245 [Chrysoperla carnea]